MSALSYSPEEIARIAHEAAEEGARVALARLAPLLLASAAPKPSTNPYVNTAEAARRMGKSVKTVREYLRLAPRGEHAFAWKYGRDWRIHYEGLENWLRADGPRLAATEIGRITGRA